MSDHENNENDDRVSRWVDGDLEPSERAAFEAAMERDPVLRREAEAAARIGSVLRSHLTKGREMPDPDWFNDRVLKAIGGGGVEAPSAAGGRGRTREVVVSGPASWFRLPWAVAAAACAVALASVVTRDGRSDAPSAGVVYAPDPHVHADIFFDADAGATVVLLDGLEELPADREVMPYRVAGYERSAISDRIVFFSEEHPDVPLYVLVPHGASGGRSIHAID